MSDLPQPNQPVPPIAPAPPAGAPPLPPPTTPQAPPQPSPLPAPPQPAALPPAPPPPSPPTSPALPGQSPPPPPNAGQPTLPPKESPGLGNSPAAPSDVKGGKLKKIIIAIIAIIILVAIGAGAYFFINNRSSSGSSGPSISDPSTSAKPDTPPVTLVYWGLWEPASVMEPIFQEYQQQNPHVTIDYKLQSPQDYRERLQSALARGDGPDIFRFHNTWVPMFTKELDTLPESVMSSSEYQSTFYQVITEDLQSGDSFVGIPLMIDGLGLYYNKSIFTSAGKSPPKTWDELQQTAQDLTIKSGTTIQRAGIALGTSGNVDHFSDIIGLMLLQNGADPADPTDSFAADALDYYTRFAIQYQVWDETLPQSTFAFATEKAVMMIAPSWRSHEIKEINPDLDFAVVSLPQLPGKTITWATYYAEGVSSSSKSKDQAWDLLKFLSSKETLRKLYTNASNQRLFGEPFPRLDLADQLIDDPVVGAYIDQATTARSWPMAGSTFDNGLNDGVIKYYEDATTSVVSGEDPEQALQTAAQGVVQILSRYSGQATSR